jgi:hypothetical protein
MVIVPEPAWVTDAVIDPGNDVAVYVVIVAPPFSVGAVNGIEILVADTTVGVETVGAFGATASVVIEEEALEATDAPALLVAFTVNV